MQMWLVISQFRLIIQDLTTIYKRKICDWSNINKNAFDTMQVQELNGIYNLCEYITIDIACY